MGAPGGDGQAALRGLSKCLTAPWLVKSILFLILILAVAQDDGMIG